MNASSSLDVQTRRISWTAILLSACLSLCILAVRNVYDDEVSSLQYVPLSVSHIVAQANSVDVHPPGMYLLDHLSYELIPSLHWFVVVELLVLSCGLSVFVLSVLPLIGNNVGRLTALLLILFHPQVLMWGNTNRWYGWWTGLALLVVCFAVQASKQDARLTVRRAILVGCFCGTLFYVGYFTIVFTAALLATMILRYWRRGFLNVLWTAGVTCLVTVPQLRYFLLVHVPGSAGQRASPVSAFVHMVYALTPSEAYLPWNPVAILALLTLLGLSFSGLWYLTQISASREIVSKLGRATWSLFAFGLILGLLTVITGLGGKPRSALLVTPFFAFAIAAVVARIKVRSIAYCIFGILVAWCGVGVSHLLLRNHLAKSSMINKPEEVVSYIHTLSPDGCAVAVTYDSGLPLTLRAKLPSVPVLIAGQNPVFKLNPSPATSTLQRCASVKIYWIFSSVGGFGPVAAKWTAKMNDVEASSGPVLEQGSLSPDLDAQKKKKNARLLGVDASEVPAYRYLISVSQVTAAQGSLLTEELSPFVIADGTTEPAHRW